MKILIVNKFYYSRGGDCTAVLSQENLLKSKGHEVAIFSTQHPDNLYTSWSTYFPEGISFNMNNSSKMKAGLRLFYPLDVRKRFLQLLDNFQPDIIHAHNIHSHISPFIIKLAKKRNIKVIWTLHDYKLICPAYTLFRNRDICELCISKSNNVLRKKCIKNSYIASFMGYLEQKIWNRTTLERYTDYFISPSHFLKEEMSKGGFNTNKITVLHNFIGNDIITQSIPDKKDDYYCFVGRIVEEKGVDILLSVAKELPYQLKVIGGGKLLNAFKQEYSGYKNIEFLDQQDHEKTLKLIKYARFMVVPSLWLENNPYSIIESLCMGTPVIGANTGGIPELISINKNGLLFSPGNPQELKEQIIRGFNLLSDTFDHKKIAAYARQKFSADLFYDKLIQLYESESK